MIKSKDRSGYIGASDTKYVMSNWNTKTFQKWWLTKIGIDRNDFTNKYIMAGTNWEHRILEHINSEYTDEQKIIGRLRVNIDGRTDNKIQEVKTYNLEKGFEINKSYYMQCQVEMYAFDTEQCEIIAYGLEEEDYKNYLRDIDDDRLSIHKIDYDERFIESYLKRLHVLEECLEHGKMPMEEYLWN